MIASLAAGDYGTIWATCRVRSRDTSKGWTFGHPQDKGNHGGVIQYDIRSTGSGGKWERRGALNKPPSLLRKALSALRADGFNGDLQFTTFRAEAIRTRLPAVQNRYAHPGRDQDRLYEASYKYVVTDVDDCSRCDPAKLIQRQDRYVTTPEVHYGLIASGNTTVERAIARDKIVQTITKDIICFNKEAAGLMDNFPCLVIKGIRDRDYADSHNSDRWHCYASSTAAAFAKQLLLYVSTSKVTKARTARDILGEMREIRSHVAEINDMLNLGREEEHQRQVKKILSALYTCPYAECKGRNSRRVVGTCRPYDDIKRGFQGLKIRLPTIHLSGENEQEVEKIATEIDLVVNHMVNQIAIEKSLNTEESAFLLQQLTAVPHRTCLWVYLVINIIKKTPEFTKGNVRCMINTLPKTVEEAYEKILSRSFDEVKAKKLQQIVTTAKRPLSLTEILVALAIDESHNSLKNLEEELELELRFRDTVRNLCGFFVVVIDQRLYLLHQSAREFLVRGSQKEARAQQGTKVLWSSGWKQSLALLARGAPFESRDGFGMTPLAVAAFQGHAMTVYILVRKGADVNTQDDQKQTPLFKYSSITVGQLLVKGGADLETKDKFGRTALVHRLKMGSPIQFLLHQGADIDAKDAKGRSPLVLFAAHAPEETIVVLLQAQANVGAEDYKGRTPLMIAAKHGRVLISRLLLDAGSNIEATDNKGQTPLIIATKHGSPQVIRMFLLRGATIELDDHQGRTAITWAGRKGHDDVVNVLEAWYFGEKFVSQKPKNLPLKDE
ncbi:hypothetical protein MMC25_002282 [Agyrium rufum]|nr:hypothetical protein [Agyrium rufum]